MSKQEGASVDGVQPPEKKETKVDAFGDGGPATPPAEKQEKKYDPIPDDHPTITALKQQIEAVKTEYGGNLSGQRAVIERLEKEINALKGGKKPEGAGAGEGGVDVLYKPEEIKWSKDLTQEQKDEMTETEIKQMDEIAAMKTAQNKMYADQQKGKKVEAETKVNDLQGWVKSAARELSRQPDGTFDTALANQIIEAAKMFNFEGLDEDKVRERVAAAAKHVPDYKPPKEQTDKRGKPVAPGAAADDPFGVNAIVEDVHKKKEAGSYQL